MTHEEFNEVYYPKYNSVIKAIARKLVKSNDTLLEDLYQEGLIALWMCNPQDAKKNPDAYIRQAVRFRMIDFLRRQKYTVTESLDAHMEAGRQVADGEAEGHWMVYQWTNSSTTRKVRDVQEHEWHGPPGTEADGEEL